jgi:hypothetical protein|nr:MAG TPA: hypothetical protein [Caudoviricetes sp.]
MQFSKIFLKIIIHNQKSIVKDIRLIPQQQATFPESGNKKKDLHIQKNCICKPFA